VLPEADLLVRHVEGFPPAAEPLRQQPELSESNHQCGLFLEAFDQPFHSWRRR
jgi:hypothetical protein